MTLLIPSPYFVRVIRLVLAAICALALAFSPAAASGAFAAPAGMPGCTMGGHMPAKPANQAKMDCCTPACQMAAAALLPEPISTKDPLDPIGVMHERASTAEFASFTPSGLDPPPRTIVS